MNGDISIASKPKPPLSTAKFVQFHSFFRRHLFRNTAPNRRVVWAPSIAHEPPPENPRRIYPTALYPQWRPSKPTGVKTTHIDAHAKTRSSTSTRNVLRYPSQYERNRGRLCASSNLRRRSPATDVAALARQ
jgi:hypothetical protein